MSDYNFSLTPLIWLGAVIVFGKITFCQQAAGVNQTQYLAPSNRLRLLAVMQRFWRWRIY